MKHLVLSKNHRFLVWEDGVPFFWLGDTVWELFHRTRIEEAEYYLEDRRQKGFTVLQAVVLAEFEGLTVPNAYGECPLLDNDPLRPNEAYFHYVDQVFELAGRKDLIIGLLPTWGDKIELLAHGKGPIIFNPENARRYGEWIGSRYRNVWNLIWINGGDRQGGGSNRAIWEALAQGIKSADPNHLMTFHPPGGNGGRSSSEWFHQSDWLDFNLAQSGHERKHLANDEIVTRDYDLQPVKPCLDGEPRYEDHPVNWRPQELGWFDDYDVRQAAYWAVFAGAFGHTYGCHPVWQLLDERYAPVTFARRSWRQALNLPGARQMRHLRDLIESRPMLSRVPDQSLLVDEKTGAEHRRACRGEGYCFIYLPQGGAMEVNLEPLQESRLCAWWYDPRTGNAQDIGVLPHKKRLEITAPWTGPCSDWVLVIDSTEKSFPAPGKTQP
ncbi:MAG: glycoside hydrolase family 140 protein [Limisphaerales bacterium]